eukprot:scaffold76087_cov18-Tisochrysis_lutea.AAC.1
MRVPLPAANTHLDHLQCFLLCPSDSGLLQQSAECRHIGQLRMHVPGLLCTTTITTTTAAAATTGGYPCSSRQRTESDKLMGGLHDKVVTERKDWEALGEQGNLRFVPAAY